MASPRVALASARATACSSSPSTAEACETAPPGEMKEDGLGLIVAGVTGGDRGRADLLRGAAEELVARTTRVVLAPCGFVRAPDPDRCAHTVGELSDEVCIGGGRLRTGAVIEVRHVEGEAEFVGEVGEKQEQRG